jgi:hypothetical protein
MLGISAADLIHIHTHIRQHLNDVCGAPEDSVELGIVGAKLGRRV